LAFVLPLLSFWKLRADVEEKVAEQSAAFCVLVMLNTVAGDKSVWFTGCE